MKAARGDSGKAARSLATGRSNTVAPNLGEVGAWLMASRDGKTILYTRVDSSTDDIMLVENFR